MKDKGIIKEKGCTQQELADIGRRFLSIYEANA